MPVQKIQETKSAKKKGGAFVKTECSEMKHHLTHDATKFIKR